MTDIITRGAAAMADRRRELQAQPLERIWLDLMRAAVEAMREPTDEMYIAAMWVTRDTGYGHCADTVGGAAYRAMIDQALKVQP